jgi:hypothetical protein
MPTRLRPTLVLVALLALALSRPVAAQTPLASAPFDLAGLEGIQRAGMRAYAFDVGDLAEAVSSPEGGTNAPAGLVFLYGVAAEFGAPEQASTAMDDIARELGDELTDEGDGDLRFTLRAAEVADLGDRATRITGTGTGTSRGDPAALGGYIVRQGSWVYVALAVGTSDAADDADAAARGVVEFALGHDAGSDGGQYRDDGTSEGGLWAKLPGNGDQAALHGMTPMADLVLAPTSGNG